MKVFLILFLIPGFALLADECTDTASILTTFKGASKWTNTTRFFTPFEVLGIQMQAIERALDKCRQSGAKLCGIQASSPSSINGGQDRKTWGQALVVSLDALPLAEGALFSQSKSLSPGTASNQTLLSLGIKFQALANTLLECFGAGNDYCAVLSVSNGFIDRSKITGEASVRGFRLDLNRLKI